MRRTRHGTALLSMSVSSRPTVPQGAQLPSKNYEDKRARKPFMCIHSVMAPHSHCATVSERHYGMGTLRTGGL